MSLVLIGKDLDLLLEAKQWTNGFQVYRYISCTMLKRIEQKK